MPRLSLYRPEKGQDFKFLDKEISEIFQVGAPDAYLHKYLGTETPETGTADQPAYAKVDITNIQDMLFLENRDRVYDSEIYRLRAYYKIQDIDFSLSQFGMFIDQDTLYLTVHINDFINTIGRKPISGDVIELPNLKDDFALNSFDMSLPRYYVVEDVSRSAEGFTATWWPHLYRMRLKRMNDTQQFASILDEPAADGASNTLRDLMSTNSQSLTINSQIVAQAEADAALSGYETRQFYTLAVDPTTGKPLLANVGFTNSNRPVRTGYTGYLVGDGFPVNGYDFGVGIQFPATPQTNDFFLRTDFLPNRLFRFDGLGWVKVEDAVRMTMTNTNSRQTQKTSFINNDDNYIYFDSVGKDVVQLAELDTVIKTRIPYNETTLTALFLEIKLVSENMQFVIADYPSLIEQYQYTNNAGFVDNCIQINLPVINNVQQTISTAGQWNISLYNSRVAQKQSLSDVLRPRAPL